MHWVLIFPDTGFPAIYLPITKYVLLQKAFTRISTVNKLFFALENNLVHIRLLALSINKKS